MSMVQLTVMQWLSAFLAYTGLTVGLPAVVLYPKVKDSRAVTRFFSYFSVGNFYLMNVVYALQLLHISYRFTLIAATAIPAVFFYMRIRNISVRESFREHKKQMGRVIRGSFGVKNWLRRTLKLVLSDLCRCIKFAWKRLDTYFMDVVLCAVVAAVVLGFYGQNLVTSFGYAASDIPVHNYWINAMGRNEIFVGGVYPFGFHNIVYFIHVVFGTDTYVLLRVFWLIQVFWLHFIMLMFLKGVCKSRFLPYLGPIVFAVGGFYFESYKRYYASLPQEFGMLYILPAVYFAFKFFQIKKEEIKGWREHPVSKYYLMGFAVNFAMTFSVHFYGTIILGIFCVGIACGYFVRFVRPKYFGKVVKTCLIGLFLALLPMVLAYATGTRLEGSLRWAISVMKGTGEETGNTQQVSHSRYEFDENGMPIGAPIVELEDGTLAYKDELDNGSVVYYPIYSEDLSEEEKQEAVDQGYIGNAPPDPQEEADEPQKRIEDLKNKALQVFGQVDQMVEENEFNEQSGELRYLIYLAILVCIAMTPLFLLARRFDYAFTLVSVSVYTMLMMFLLCMSAFGLPQLMDASRSSVYLAYAIPLVWILALDAVLYFLFGMWKWWVTRGIMDLTSFAVFLLCIALFLQTGMHKRPHEVDRFETNGAVTCLTNIIADNPDDTWTIVSANDETRMGEDHGFHYELLTFLQEMEYSGGISMITIPTHKVYFFVEKIPLDYYYTKYENSGQKISKEGASRPLPDKGGINSYIWEDRWILMSRMYEWAQTFQSMYPNEMQVYYEDDEFVCYELEQNDYHLYNFSIDYGYNMR